MAEGDNVVATRLKAASMLCISFSASAIVVSSGRVELHFMLRSAIFFFFFQAIQFGSSET